MKRSFSPNVMPVFFRRSQGSKDLRLSLRNQLAASFVQSLIDGYEEQALLGHVQVFPVHAVWPMGFSWSSAVGQECSVGCCLRAGIQEETIMSLDHPAHEDQTEVAFAPTEDVLLLHRCPEKGAQALARLDAEMSEAGMPGNAYKNLSLESNIVGLGCELSSQPALCGPAADKNRSLALGARDFLRNPSASPQGFNAILGLSQCGFAFCSEVCSLFMTMYMVSFAGFRPTKRCRFQWMVSNIVNVAG